MKKLNIIQTLFLLSGCAIAPHKNEGKDISLGFYAVSSAMKANIKYSRAFLPKKISYKLEINEKDDFRVTKFQIFDCDNANYEIDKSELDKLGGTFSGIKTNSLNIEDKFCEINDIEIDIITRQKSTLSDENVTQLKHNLFKFLDGKFRRE